MERSPPLADCYLPTDSNFASCPRHVEHPLDFVNSGMAASQDYQVTARKWRPAEFASVVGQEHITQTLKNAIRNNRLHHAFLFSGPRGVGKTTTARILARALNCQNPGEDYEPCGECESCRSISEGRSLDVVEIDGASNNSVEDIRTLRDNAKYPPVSGRYKLYIIDEVHMLSTSAFNALLKTLEEPPKHLIFIFATTEPHKVLPTILSRCQRFDFRRMQIEDIVLRLRFIAGEEGMNPEEDGLVVIARKADGSMRDAQSIFDQVVAFCGPDFTYAQVNEALNLIDQEFFFRVTGMMRQGNPADAFAITDHIMQTGYDTGEFLIGLAEHFRNLLSVLTTGSSRLIETTTAIRDRYQEDAAAFQQGDIIRALHLTLGVQSAIRTSSQPRLRLELLLIQLAMMDSTVRLDELLNAIKGIPEGTILPPSSPSGGSGSPSSGMGNSSSIPTPGPSSSPSSSASPSSSGGDLPSGNGGNAAENSATENAPVRSSAEGNVTSSAGSSEAASGPVAKVENGSANGSVNGAANGNGEGGKRDRLSGLRDFPTGAPPQRPGAAPMIGEASVSYANGSAENGTLTQIAGVSIGELQGQWRNFLEFCEDRKTALAALHAAVPGEVHGNVVRLFVENEFQSGLIRQYQEVLVEKFRAYFKAPLIVEGVIGAAPTPLANIVEAVPAAAAGARHPDEDHPFIRGIIELLGAVKI